MKVYYTSHCEEDGHRWFYINGSTGYDLDSGWTEEEAIADFESPEHAAEDYEATMRAFGAYED